VESVAFSPLKQLTAINGISEAKANKLHEAGMKERFFFYF
jgi:hypothetical protein